jgi:hypothetical protein
MDLGKITTLSLNEVWAMEERDFTPWLSRNLEFLEEALGVDMECLNTEINAGDGARHADMLIEFRNGGLGIIENQYGKADPSHGWRTLHYAVSLSAPTAIWIFEDISSDDEKLISFINSNTEGLDIIGVKATICKIDDSAPAINFSVIPVSREALERLQNSVRLSSDITVKESFYGKFFPKLIAEVSSGTMLKGNHSASKGHWNYYCSWNSSYGCRNPWEAAFNQKKGGDGRYYIHLMLRDNNSKANFHYLKNKQSELVNNIPTNSYELEWDYVEDRKSQKIKFYYPHTVNVESLDSAEVSNIMSWTKDILVKLNSSLSRIHRNQLLYERNSDD